MSKFNNEQSRLPNTQKVPLAVKAVIEHERARRRPLTTSLVTDRQLCLILLKALHRGIMQFVKSGLVIVIEELEK